MLDDPVAKLEPALKRVLLKSGRSLGYGALLLATGARPRKLDIEGAALPHVLTLRTLADSRKIIEAAAGKQRAAVVGSSFIGLEVAASLRHRGLSVDVVSPDRVPLERVLGEEIGRFVHRLHEEHGVRFHLGRRPKRIDEKALTLDDDQLLAAELVVVGVGVVPNQELAESAGIEVKNGILVDRALRTSLPSIYAAGDVARYPDPIGGELARIEHFAFAVRQGQFAAQSLLGLADTFNAVPFFWSQHYDVSLSYVGHAASWDRIETRGSLAARDYAAAFVKDERIQAVATLGRDRQSLEAEAAFEVNDRAALARLFA